MEVLLEEFKARRRIFHVPNTKWTNSNKEIGSLTLGSADEKFDVWPTVGGREISHQIQCLDLERQLPYKNSREKMR